MASRSHRTTGTDGTDGTNDTTVTHKSARRGIVNMLKVKRARSKGIVQKVDWNDLGQPIGKGSITLSHYLGAAARRHVPITCDHWRKKDWHNMKEALWDEIKAPSKNKNNENGKNAKAQEMLNNKEKEKTVESIAVVSSRQLLGYPLDQDVSHDGVLEMVRLTVIVDRVTDVEIEMGPFWDGDTWTDHLNKENVLEVLDEQWLSASSLAFYIRYLCEVYLSKNPNLAAKFSFVSPHIVSHLVDISEASSKLANFMLGYVDKEHLLLVPYNVSEHWILLGINTKTESVYFMDPAPRGTIVKYKHLKRLVETALMSFRTGCGKTYTKTAFSTFKWTNILCPKQPANDGIFCGHYVGCFIEDVLRSGETSISVNFTRSIRLMCYGRDKMLRFRDNWAGFFYNRYLKGKLLNM